MKAQHTLLPLRCDGCNGLIEDPKMTNIEWIVYPKGKTWAGRDLRILHKGPCMFNNEQERQRDGGAVNWHPLEWALALKSVDDLRTLLLRAPKDEITALAQRLGIPATPSRWMCETCGQAIRTGEDGEIQGNRFSRCLRLVHRKGASPLVGDCTIPFVSFTRTLAGALEQRSEKELIAWFPAHPSNIRALATRLGTPNPATTTRRTKAKVAPLVCDVCHEPITKGGNLEWVELPNGEVRDVRMVHKWSCVAKRSVEYAKDRGEVQWVPLPRRPSVHTLATILQGASPEQVGEAARRMGISHPYTALLAALAQQAAHQQGRSPEFRARQGI